MLTKLCVDEQASYLACPSCLVLAGILDLLVIPFSLGFIGFFNFLATSLQADKCRLSLSACSFP